MNIRILFCIGILSLTASIVAAQPVVNSTNDSFDDGTLERARNAYWNTIRTSGEEKDLSVIDRASFEATRRMENRAMFKSLAGSSWQQVAGSVGGHSSGRIRGIAIDPTDTKVVYIAAAGGGIWKTNDITAKPVNWIDLSSRLPTTNFGAIAIDPSNPSVLFAGTGESEGDGYQNLYGMGVYKSVDGGLSWNQVVDISKAGNYCSQILIDSTNSQNIYIATGSGSPDNLLVSHDGGSSWKNVSVGVTPLSIAYSSKAPNRLYVSGFGSIFRSGDFGATWTKCTTGLTGSSFGRIDVACAPSAPNIVYASIGSISDRKTIGVWISTDSGVTWRNKYLFNRAIAEDPKTNPNPLGNQEEWCNAIVVRPNLPSQIFVAGLDIYWSTDSGAHYQKVSDWTAVPTDNKYVHADQHHMALMGGTLYVCTDGGLAVGSSQTSFGVWNTEVNEGLATLQFVGADADSGFTYVTGGCQDNGTLRSAVGVQDFTLTHSGDGGRGWVSTLDSSVVYTTYVYTTFFKSDNAGHTYGGNLLVPNSGLYQTNAPGGGPGEGAPFYPAYDVSADGSIVAFGGNSHVWVSTNGGADAFADNRSDSAIGSAYTMHVSQKDPTNIWAASGNRVWRTVNGSYTSWHSCNLAETVTGITSNPNNDNQVFAVTYGTGSSAKHFFVSNDGGKTFTSPSKALANLPCWSIAYHPGDGRLFIGTDNGVFFSDDTGVSWYPVMNGMPYVRVTSMKARGVNYNTLLAATYGRGLFSLDLSTLGTNSGATANSLRLDPVRPNPLTGSQASVAFSLASPGLSELKLFDLLGREIKTLDKNYYSAGSHTVTFGCTGLTNGTYVVVLISGGRSVSQKIVVE